MTEEQTSDVEAFTIPELCELLQLTPGKVHRLIEEHYLAALRVNGVWRVPADFLQDGQPVPALRGTMLSLLDAGFTADEAINWLFADNPELGEKPIAAMRSGKKSAVRRATQALAF